MQTLTIFIITTSVATALGYIVYRITKRYVRNPWLRATISIFSGGLVFLAAAVIFIFYGFFIPSTDSHVLVGEQQHLRISLSADSSVKQNNGYDVEIFAPESTGVDQDFSFRLSVSHYPSTTALSSLTAVLSFPDSVQARTLNSCRTQSVPGIASDAVAACSSKNKNTDQSNHKLTWDITPTRAGSIVLAVELLGFPPADGPIDVSKNWQANIELNGEEIFSDESGTYVGPLRGSSGGVTFVPFFLTPKNPSVQISNFYLDLSSMHFRVPVRVEYAPAIDSKAYKLLAVIGSILAGALGTGWLWQLIQFVRNRSKSDS